MASIRLKTKIPGVPAGAGTRGYRWWTTADFSHSAGTAHGAPPYYSAQSSCSIRNQCHCSGVTSWCRLWTRYRPSHTTLVLAPLFCDTVPSLHTRTSMPRRSCLHRTLWTPLTLPFITPSKRDHRLGGMFARRATFLLTIPTSAPDLPSHGEAPQVDHVALHTFPTKHVAK